MIKVIMGLGNPGPAYFYTRHNIGFRVVDALAQIHGASWRKRDNMEVAEVSINGKTILLIKPQTFMNSSGAVWPWLAKQGIQSNELIVVHDELELPFGKVATKLGGSAKGHNGLKSIIAHAGDQFYRVRCGISRPENKEDVPSYVLQKFSESSHDVDTLIDNAVRECEKLLNTY